MKLLRCTRVVLLFTACLSSLGLAGCIITSVSHTNITGKAISDDVFAKIQPGQSKNDVVTLLGQPSQKSSASGDEIWKWTYIENKTDEHTFIVVFAGMSKTTTTQTTDVEFGSDGKVTRAWRE